MTQKIDLNNLDKGTWESFKFDEIAQKISKTVKPEEAEVDIYVGLEHIDANDIHIRRKGVPADVKGGKLRCYPEDVIFGKRRAYQRKAAIVDFDGICSAHAFVFRANPKVIDPKLFPFFLHSDQFMHKMVDISVGGLSPTINWGDLKPQEFLLPPKGQQAKLAELLWAMDEVIEKDVLLYTRIHQLYLSMRSNMMIGKEHINSEKSYNYKKVKRFGQIPENWSIKSLSELCIKIQDGNYGESYPKKEELLDEGIPFITSTVISEDKVDTNKLKYITPKKHEELKKAHIKNDDILLTNRGANVGRCAVAIPSLDNANIGPQVTLIRCDKEKLDNQFLYHFIRSNYVQKQIEIANAGSAMNFMSLTSTSAFLIVCPPMEIQKLIAEKLNLVYSKLESITLKLESSKALQKSLINKVF